MQKQAGFNSIQQQLNQEQQNIIIVQTIGAYTKKESSKLSYKKIKLEQQSCQSDNIIYQDYVKQEYSQQSSTAQLFMNQQYHQDSLEQHSSRTTGENQQQQQQQLMYTRENSHTKTQKQKPSQSQVKNANKFYFKKFLTHLLSKNHEKTNVISNTEFQELLDRIKKSGNRDNYTLKHFRAVCLKLGDKNMEKLSEQDKKCHEFIFGAFWENQQYELINQIKTTISALILEYIEQNTTILREIKMKWADQPDLIDRYSNWKMHLSINIRKMLQGQYVSRF